ncbi:cytochrome P450 [Guyanagaster necrorhizus]|uniref:Cytochrome P450 n=1 Tax=Guyanagaster necrorhizus TaxID=856835 RepID=A0A9P7VZI9_9AGAR|nr:cytochrome P450 [Guyanagaster necrorhizus MCA 3950]KAG7450028.1 cytochrome P450 [Guyanagaster necrorhizus MCA 3950]
MSLQLKEIPTVGSSGIIASWIDAFRFVFHGEEIVREGYAMYYGGTFKVPLLDKWMVVVSGAEKIDDIRKASHEQLSFVGAAQDIFQVDYTMGPSVAADTYHADVIRSSLTRNISACFADVQDEIKMAFKDNIPMTEDWTGVPAYKTILQIVCRASNRMFVGLPLCRNPDYIKLNIDFTVDVVACAHVINLFPSILKPIVGSVFTPRRRATFKMEKLLGVNIQERLHQDDVHGKDWPEKPNDLLSWLIDGSNGNSERRTVPDLIARMLFMNFAAIHTTSMSFTTALFALAAHPEYAQTLRSEVETIITEEGWTKSAMGKMNQLDSFLQEAQRLYGGLGILKMNRLVKKDFVFSDGTVVPAGYHLSVAADSTHMCEENYQDPLEFKPWRFSDLRKREGEGIRHQMVTPTLDYIFFGNGRPACPGRFFAVTELKALLSHVLLNFDVKMDKVPESGSFLFDRFPNKSSKVLFRKRATSCGGEYA